MQWSVLYAIHTIYFLFTIGKNLEVQLAQLGSKCSGVVICRSSPSQKAAVVRIMREYEMRQIQKEFGAPIFGLFKRQKAIIKVRENRKVCLKLVSL